MTAAGPVEGVVGARPDARLDALGRCAASGARP